MIQVPSDSEPYLLSEPNPGPTMSDVVRTTYYRDVARELKISS